MFPKALTWLSFLFTFSFLFILFRENYWIYQYIYMNISVVGAFNLNWLVLHFLLQAGSIYLFLRTVFYCWGQVILFVVRPSGHPSLCQPLALLSWWLFSCLVQESELTHSNMVSRESISCFLCCIINGIYESF